LLAARLTSQIIKAYVEKQRRIRNNPMLFSDKADPGSVPIAGVWNQPETPDHDDASSSPTSDHQQVAEDNRVQGGTFLLSVRPPKPAKPARPLALGLAGVN
jgi:hypothetical protein